MKSPVDRRKMGKFSEFTIVIEENSLAHFGAGFGAVPGRKTARMSEAVVTDVFRQDEVIVDVFFLPVSQREPLRF